MASCSSVLVYVNRPPTKAPTKYTSHANRPTIKKKEEQLMVINCYDNTIHFRKVSALLQGMRLGNAVKRMVKVSALSGFKT